MVIYFSNEIARIAIGKSAYREMLQYSNGFARRYRNDRQGRFDIFQIARRVIHT